MVILFLLSFPSRRIETSEPIAEQNPALIVPLNPNEVQAGQKDVADANGRQRQNPLSERERPNDGQGDSAEQQIPTEAVPKMTAEAANEKLVWRKFRHPKGVAEIDMPGKAILNPDNSQVPAESGSIKISIPPPAEMHLDHPTNFVAEFGDIRCSLMVNKLAPFLVATLAKNPNEFTNILKILGGSQRDHLTLESGNDIAFEKEIKLGKAVGREFGIYLPARIIIVRWYMTQTHEYVASMVLPNNRDAQNEFGRFFNSLRIESTDDFLDSPGGIPRKVREYFERADFIKESILQKLENQRTIQILHANGAVEAKSSFKSETKKLEDKLKELKRSKVTAYMPADPSLGDVGSFQHLEVETILDKNTVIVSRFLPSIAGEYRFGTIGIVQVDAKKIKTGQTVFDSDVFRIVATEASNSPLMNDDRLRVLGTELKFVVEPVKKSEIEKYRTLYEVEKN